METGDKLPNAKPAQGSKLPQGSQLCHRRPHNEGSGTGGVHMGLWEESGLCSDRSDYTLHPAADPPHRNAAGCHSRRTPSQQPSARRGASDRARALRVNINARERRRMHDLNEALEELRASMPYRAGPTAKKLSKIATLLLARNHILLQARALEQMRRMVGQLKFGHSVHSDNTAASAAGGGGVCYQPELLTEMIIR